MVGPWGEKLWTELVALWESRRCVENRPHKLNLSPNPISIIIIWGMEGVLCVFAFQTHGFETPRILFTQFCTRF